MHRPDYSVDPTEIWTTEVEREPAVQAWSRLQAGRAAPERVELLRRCRKSAVFRLPGVGRGGRDVVAKQCQTQQARDERAIYEALCGLPGAYLEYYGFVDEPGGDAWLFVEDARGEPWDRNLARHRELAARWLAALHTTSSRATIAAGLPDRGPAFFREHLTGARRMIRGGFGNPALRPEGRVTLERVLAQLDAVEQRWADVEAACARMPRALVHGDFAKRNVRIRPGGAGSELLAFDWEVGGWGVPGVDLVQVDLPTYRAAVRNGWPELDLPALERLVALGALLRWGCAASKWASQSLDRRFVENAVCDLSTYHERTLRALGALGWL